MPLLMSRFLKAKFALPLLVLASGSALSVALGLSIQRETAVRAEQRFDALAIETARKVEDRFDAYTGVLVGLRALFNTSETVTRQQFRQYVDGLNMPMSYPGFQVLNYAPYVAATDKPAFEQWLRQGSGLDPQLAPKLAIAPGGDRPHYHPFAFIEPMNGNERVLGRDLSATPAVLKALEQARDTGGVTTSGRKIKINGRDSDIGLAMRLPVYRANMPLDTAEQRRAAYIGSVGAGFHLAEMMRDLVNHEAHPGMQLRLFDAGVSKSQIGLREESRLVDASSSKPSMTSENLLFDSASSHSAARSTGSRKVVQEEAAPIQRTLAFQMGGHTWVVEVLQDPESALTPLDRSMPWLMFLGAMAISTLLAGIVYSLTTSRKRAEALADSMTSHLRSRERQLEDAQHLATLGSWTLDAETGRMFCSDEAMRIFGFEPRITQPTLSKLLLHVPPEDRASVELHIGRASMGSQRSEFEHRLDLPDGTERWVHVIVQAGEEQDGKTLLRGTVRDDTQRQKASLRLKLEHEIARLLVADGDPERVMSNALEAVCMHLGWDCASFWGLNEGGTARCHAAWRHPTDPALEHFVRISRTLTYRKDEGSLGRAWSTGKVINVDTSTVQDTFTRDAMASHAGLCTGLIVPMSDAGTMTALEIYSRRARTVDAETLESLRAIALQIAQYEHRKRAEQALRYVADHDALTGLSNRSALQHDLTRAIKRSNRQQKRLAVMFVDIDRFKRINDTLGHGAGDAMIKACGERLAGVLREDDTVARFGGDEFVLVLENLTKSSDAALVADKVLACCAEPFVIGDRELHVTVSVGVSVYPEDGSDGETLLKNADTAMYRAKDKGRGGCQFYAAQMNEQGSERLMLENGLRRAVERGELELHYQPKQNLRTQGIVGVEALMRWRHPVLGLVSPAQFIPIAEETGLIIEMGKWALMTACSDAREWQSRGLPPVQMSVNLSPRQLNSPTLLADVAAALADSGLEPALLELEITETAMMSNPEQATALLQEIRNMGVGLAIDDFGTGYSSLSYLKRFPLSTVKIDRSFVKDISQDPDAQALIDAIIRLSHGLRMKVIAEGVETPEQLAELRARECDEIQGFLLCKPTTAEEVCTFMSRHLRTLFAAPVAA